MGYVVTYRVIDRGLLEMIGPLGIARVLKTLTQRVSNIQSGLVFNYLLVMIAFTAVLVVAAGQ